MNDTISVLESAELCVLKELSYKDNNKETYKQLELAFNRLQDLRFAEIMSEICAKTGYNMGGAT